jgi:hypothetical protein
MKMVARRSSLADLRLGRLEVIPTRRPQKAASQDYTDYTE